MSTAGRLLPPLLAIALIAAAASAAAEPEAVATAAPAGPGAPPTVAEQIDNYLKTSPAVLPSQGTTGVTSGSEPRKIHGVVDVAVGTGGYRSAYVQTDMSVGKGGTLSIAVRDTQFKGRYGAYRQQGAGLGLALGDATPYGADPRCRQALGMDAARPDSGWMDARRPRACPPLTPTSAQ